MDGPVLMGRNSLREVLRRRPESLQKIYVSESLAEGASEIIDLARAAGVPHETRQSAQLTSAVGSDSHQGAIGILRPRIHPELKEFISQARQLPRALVVMADSIYDPHNLGAILRACECFGVSGVVISKNRGTGITPVVTKSAVGATELVPICIVSNLAQALQRLLDEGFEAIAADVGPDAVDLPDCHFPDYAVLVLGSEGDGVQPLLRKLCGQVAKIPMHGAIDSLNVSQAAAVFTYAWSAARHQE